MRAVIQRVSRAKVTVAGKEAGEIGSGLLVLLGIEGEDTAEDRDWLIKKLINMRIFPDDKGNMNIAVTEAGGDILVVSQFTLHAGTKKGNRPSFIKAAKPDVAKEMYSDFVAVLKDRFTGRVQTGKFGAMMDVELVNDGPVTIWLDTKNKE